MDMILSGVKHKTWADIDLCALRRNYDAIRRLAGGSDVICVVKADAYGHGAVRCVSALRDAGARTFAVSCIEEAAELASAFDDVRTLILGYTPPENADILARLGVRQTVFSPEYARALSDSARALGCRVSVHFKLDTGMNRLGFDASDPELACRQILDASSLPGIVPEGIFTHFACSDSDAGITAAQFGEYNAVVSMLEARGLHLLRHVCNSAAILRFPEMHLDAVRAGVILYGLRPWRPYNKDEFIPLEPVMTFKSTISHLHKIPRGARVSYGWTYEAPRDMIAATIPVGYADGFLRAFGDGGCVYINGQPSPIVGRVCMDQCIVDVTGIDCRVGDEVVIFGGDPDRIDTLADTARTINYELVCLIGKRVARIYKD